MDVADLSRDAAGADPGLDKIFDKEKEQRRMETAQLLAEIGSQAGDIARTQGEIAGLKAKTDPATLAAAREELAGKGNRNPTADEIAKQAYDTAMKPFGTGSSLQQGISAVTAAMQGLAGGNVAQALSGAASPYVAQKIHDLTENNPEAQAMAHAVLGAVTSYASGNSALAGAAGGVSGELMAQLVIKQLYPGKDVGELSEPEKQTISALGTLAAGLAGGVTGDSTANVLAGAQAGQNAVNNNLFGGTEDGQEKFVREHGKDVMSCADDPTSASCQRGQAMKDALTVALPVGLGGGVLIAATPEIAAILKAGIESCSGALALCINNLGLQASEIIVPGGVGASGAVGIGKTAAEAAAAKAENVANNTAKNNPSWKAGDYLNDFKPSPTPLELVKEQAGKGSQTAYIRMDHILNGEVKTLKDGTKVGSGGHYIRDSNIKIDKVTGTPDTNGVSTGYISVRDQATGQWINKKAETTFFPEQWSKRQTAQEIESAFKNSYPDPFDKNKWQGISSSGVKIQGYYGKPDGTGATAWPVYGGSK